MMDHNELPHFPDEKHSHERVVKTCLCETFDEALTYIAKCTGEYDDFMTRWVRVQIEPVAQERRSSSLLVVGNGAPREFQYVATVSIMLQ